MMVIIMILTITILNNDHTEPGPRGPASWGHFGGPFFGPTWLRHDLFWGAFVLIFAALEVYAAASAGCHKSPAGVA